MDRSRHSLSFLTLAVVVLLVAAPWAAAQPGALEWELIGEPFDVRGLFAEPQHDTIYTIGFDGLFSTQPDGDTWTLITDDVARANDDVFVSHSGALFGIDLGFIERSADGGETWEEVIDRGQLAPVYTPAGALVTNRDGIGPSVARSTDDGQTWTLIDLDESLGFDLFPITFAALPATDDLPGGRLVAGGNGGLIVSSDDGLTWAETNVLGSYRATSAVRAPWEPALPDGSVDAGRGTLYAVVNDLAPGGQTGEVWESVDGVSWERVGQVPGVGGTGGQLLAARAADGSDVLYAIAVSEQEYEVYNSEDRGQTWVGTGAFDAEAIVGSPVDMEELAVGPEGRLWLAVSPGPGANRLGGVFRTTAPVVAVSSEVEPLEETQLGEPEVKLAVSPNPAAGPVRVTLMLGKAANVRVAVYDALGREVAVLRDGRLAANTRSFALDTSALLAGTYFVRAVGEHFRTSQAFTVVR